MLCSVVQLAAAGPGTAVGTVQPAGGVVSPYTTLFRSAALSGSNRPRPMRGSAIESAARGLRKALILSPWVMFSSPIRRSEEHTSELQSRCQIVCRRLLVKINALPSGVRTTNGPHHQYT